MTSAFDQLCMDYGGYHPSTHTTLVSLGIDQPQHFPFMGSLLHRDGTYNALTQRIGTPSKWRVNSVVLDREDAFILTIPDDGVEIDFLRNLGPEQRALWLEEQSAGLPVGIDLVLESIASLGHRILTVYASAGSIVLNCTTVSEGASFDMLVASGRGQVGKMNKRRRATLSTGLVSFADRESRTLFEWSEEWHTDNEAHPRTVLQGGSVDFGGFDWPFRVTDGFLNPDNGQDSADGQISIREDFALEWLHHIVSPDTPVAKQLQQVERMDSPDRLLQVQVSISHGEINLKGMGEVVPAEEWQWSDVPVIINRQCVVDEVRAEGLVSRVTPAFAKVTKSAEDWVYVEWLQQAIDTIQVLGLDTVRQANADWLEDLSAKAQSLNGYKRFSQVLTHKNIQASLDAFQQPDSNMPLVTRREEARASLAKAAGKYQSWLYPGLLKETLGIPSQVLQGLKRPTHLHLRGIPKIYLADAEQMGQSCPAKGEVKFFWRRNKPVCFFMHPEDGTSEWKGYQSDGADNDDGFKVIFINLFAGGIGVWLLRSPMSPFGGLLLRLHPSDVKRVVDGNWQVYDQVDYPYSQGPVKPWEQTPMVGPESEDAEVWSQFSVPAPTSVLEETKLAVMMARNARWIGRFTNMQSLLYHSGLWDPAQHSLIISDIVDAANYVTALLDKPFARFARRIADTIKANPQKALDPFIWKRTRMTLIPLLADYRIAADDHRSMSIWEKNAIAQGKLTIRAVSGGPLGDLFLDAARMKMLAVLEADLMESLANGPVFHFAEMYQNTSFAMGLWEQASALRYLVAEIMRALAQLNKANEAREPYWPETMNVISLNDATWLNAVCEMPDIRKKRIQVWFEETMLRIVTEAEAAVAPLIESGHAVPGQLLMETWRLLTVYPTRFSHSINQFRFVNWDEDGGKVTPEGWLPDQDLLGSVQLQNGLPLSTGQENTWMDQETGEESYAGTFLRHPRRANVQIIEFFSHAEIKGALTMLKHTESALPAGFKSHNVPSMVVDSWEFELGPGNEGRVKDLIVGEEYQIQSGLDFYEESLIGLATEKVEMGMPEEEAVAEATSQLAVMQPMVHLFVIKQGDEWIGPMLNWNAAPMAGMTVTFAGLIGQRTSSLETKDPISWHNHSVQNWDILDNAFTVHHNSHGETYAYRGNEWYLAFALSGGEVPAMHLEI